MTRHWVAAALVALGACSRVEEPQGQRRASASSVTAKSSPPPPLPAPTQLLTLPSSAYQAAIFADDDAIELLTSSAAYRLVPGKEPVRRVLDLGFAATVTRRSYVYWSNGALWSTARAASESDTPRRLAALAEPPQRLASDIGENEIAWLSHSADDRFAIETLEKRRVKRLYGSSGSIDALTLLGGAIFFVERPSTTGWRIGKVPLAGGEVSFTASKSGRWPAMLAGRRELVFYEGSRREVLALSPDLQRQRTLANDFICSPLAVAAGVYCAGVDGVFELVASAEPRLLVAAAGRQITNLAVTSERLAFIADVASHGQDQLSVSVVTLNHWGLPARE